MTRPHEGRRDLLAVTTAVLVGGLLAGCGAGVPGPTHPVEKVVAVPAVPERTHPAYAAQPAQPAGADRVEVDKCWTNATTTSGGQLLVSASSSDRAARLYAYRADGRLIGEVQNGRGQRYGGTVFPWQATDPGTVTVRSSSGGSRTVPTTPWRPES